MPQRLEGQLPTTEADPSAAASASAAPDFAALMMMLQEQSRRQEEQARRQEEQARRLEEQLQRDKEEQARRQEEQARRQEEQARRQEEQARRLEEQLQRDKEEQARRQEEQMLLMKDLHATFGKDMKEVKDRVAQHDNRLSEAEIRIDQVNNRVDNVMADVKKTLDYLKLGDGIAAPVATIPSLRGFKVPPFDGTSSWSAYKIQFEAVMKANGWNKSQAMTALTLGLRDQALTVLEALGKEVTYEQLLEALEARYGDAHLEHVFRAQLKDRVQRSNENLQQWALEVEKLVRKAYQSVPALIDGNLVQAFIDGIRDLEVRAAVRLGHHGMLKDALAHALEVEAVRQDLRSHRAREVAAATVRDRNKGYSPRCYGCGERGHLRSSCPKRTAEREEGRSPEGSAANSTAQHQQQALLIARQEQQALLERLEELKRAFDMQQNKLERVRREAHARSEQDRIYVNQLKDEIAALKTRQSKEVVPVRMLKTDLSDEWKESVQRAQQEDSDIKPILEWMKARAPKPRWSDVSAMSSITKSYWAQWDSLVIQDGVLCRKWENARGDSCHLQMVVPKAQVPDVLQLYHNGCSGGHLGVKRTLLKIRERFYWVHCRDDVEDWCRKCTSCAAVKGPQTRSRGALKLYNVGAPWERIALDVAGPFPESESGNKYFMVVMDYFTKWPEVFAIPNQEASTVADKLVYEVFCRFGVPLEIHSDQGRNFESQIFQETCRVMGTHKTRTTSYHPQSDGMVERFNQTLERYLAKVVENRQRDWDKHIQPFLLSYRSAVHESTSVTPAFANFGRELRLPADLITGIPPDAPRSITDYANDLRNKMNDIYEHVRQSGQQMSEKMKTRYDRKMNNKGFDEGSLVWLHNPVRSKGKSPKLQARWDGPYRIVTKINDVTYRIQKGARGTPKIVHVDRLARYYGAANARDEHVLGGGSVARHN